MGRSLFGGVEFGFESLQIEDYGAPAFQLEKSFRLQAGQIALNQLTDGPKLRGQFLVSARQREFHARRRRLSFALSKM